MHGVIRGVRLLSKVLLRLCMVFCRKKFYFEVMNALLYENSLCFEVMYSFFCQILLCLIFFLILRL